MTMRQAVGLDSLPVETVRHIVELLGDPEQPDHARLVAPLSLVAKRYVSVARARMFASVTLFSRRGVRAFIASLHVEGESNPAVGRLSISTLYEGRARADAAEWAASWALNTPEEYGVKQAAAERSRLYTADELEEFTGLVEVAAQAVGERVEQVEVEIHPNQLAYFTVAAKSLSDVTQGKVVRLFMLGDIAAERYGSYLVDASRAMIDLFGQAQSLHFDGPANPDPLSSVSIEFGDDGTVAFPRLDCLAGPWDESGMLLAIANEAPRLTRLTLGQSGDRTAFLGSLDPQAWAFAPHVRHLSISSPLARTYGFKSHDLPAFVALESLALNRLDNFDGRHLPQSLIEIRVADARMSAADFVTALEAAPHDLALRRIVVDHGDEGWIDDAGGLDAADVKALCARRAIELVGPQPYDWDEDVDCMHEPGDW